MEHAITKEDIAQMKGDELLNYLYEVECDIHSIEFSITHDGISEGSAVYEDMKLELKELRNLHEALMDEVVIRKEKGE
jgi:hypothetical protein